MITTKAEGLFANELGRREVASLACHVSARDWPVHGGPGAGVGCPVHGGPELVRGGGGVAWPRRCHGRGGRARRDGEARHERPCRGNERVARGAAGVGRGSAAARDGRGALATRRRETAAVAYSGEAVRRKGKEKT